MGIYLNLSEYTKSHNFSYDENKLKSVAMDNHTQIIINKIHRIHPSLNANRLVTMLINEIKYLDRIGPDHNYKIEIINNNIYHLKLKFNNNFFDTESKIYPKLIKSGESVELEINLENGLYPFSPPNIFIIKPKLKNQFNKKISQMDILLSKNWHPTFNLETVVNKFREHMCDAEINMPFESYTELENNLIKLDLLLKNSNTTDSKPEDKKPIAKIIGANGLAVENKGTGFGYSGLESWDFNITLRTKTEIQSDIVKCIKDITFNLTKLIMSGSQNKAIMTIKESCFIPYLKTVFKGNNVLELTKDISYFNVHVDSIRIMPKEFAELFCAKNKKSDTLFDILTELNIDCISYLNKIKNVLDKSINLEIDSISNFVNYYNQLQKTISKLKTNIDTQIVQELYTSKGKSIEELYITELCSESFKELSVVNTVGFSRMMRECSEKENTEFSNRASISRITKEMVTIQKSLPLYFDSSIFYRCCSNLKFHEFLITGPKDTPYDSGCFHFRLYCPSNYPISGPRAETCTTGNGNFKINPNLYASGNICLSLLGTHSGEASENWMPNESSMLQIMISIQALIFTPEPYFNESGYELYRGKSKHEDTSVSYTKEVRLYCMKLGMINQIRNPVVGFEEAIKKHFTIKAPYIKTICSQWVNESNTDKRNEYESTYKELCNELDKLTNPNKEIKSDIKLTKKKAVRSNSKSVKSRKMIPRKGANSIVS